MSENNISPAGLRETILADDPLSCADTVELIKKAIDSLLLAIASGEAVTYLEIRSRRVQFSDPGLMLKSLQTLLVYYQNCAAEQSPVRSRRNVAVFGRGRG